MWETRLAGRPDEYFGPHTRAVYAGAWGTEDDEGYVEAVLDYATTPNGIFSAKVHWPHLEHASECLRAWHGARLPSDPFSVLAPRVQYVWIRRRDKVRQAVSAARARRSGIYQWREGAPRPLDELSFDYEEIDGYVRLYTEWDARWGEYFSALSVTPEQVVYEGDLERDVAPASRRIFDLLRIQVPAGRVVSTPFQKQGDALSEELVRQYAEEAARRHHGVSDRRP